LIFDETNWRPTYYSVEDHLVFQQNIDKIKSLQGTTKIFPDYSYDFFGDDPRIIYFCFPHNGNPDDPLASDDFPGFSNDAANAVFWGSTIVYTQLQLAVHMGFKEIYLIGVDSHYILPPQKKDSYYISEGEKNHFHPDYRTPGEKWNQPNLDVHMRSFHCAKNYCEGTGIKVFNATRGGKLEIFKRIDLDSLF
jgi:hypothetical protein